MKIITEEEYNTLNFMSSMRLRHNGPMGELLKFLDKVEVNTTVLVEKSEWKIKTPVSVFINSSYRPFRSNKKFSTKQIQDNKGWIIKRIK